MKRPFSATFMLWVGFILGLVSSWRVSSWSKQADTLISYGVSPTIITLHMVGAVIGAALFWYLTWLVWKRQAIVRYLFPIALIFYALFYLLVLTFMTTSPLFQQTWFARLVFYSAGISLITWSCHRLTKQQYWQA